MNVDPSATLRLLKNQVPPSLHEHLLLVGSLAAAYHYRKKLKAGVRTKDADLVIQPAGALESCREVALTLLREGWTHRPFAEYRPGVPDTPVEKLPVVRLHPPGSTSYFVELLGLPDAGQREGAVWHRLELEDGWYAVPTFRFMGLLAHRQCRSDVGLAYAAPSLMALANALSHPTIGPQVMSEKIGGRQIRRSAKDLGRVLALAFLADDLEAWASEWRAALEQRFGDEWQALAQRAGTGVRALLASDGAFEEAHWTVEQGLLVNQGIAADALRAFGEQFIGDVLQPFAELSLNTGGKTGS